MCDDGTFKAYFHKKGHANQILKVNLTKAGATILFNKHIISFDLATEHPDGIRDDRAIRWV